MELDNRLWVGGLVFACAITLSILIRLDFWLENQQKRPRPYSLDELYPAYRERRPHLHGNIWLNLAKNMIGVVLMCAVGIALTQWAVLPLEGIVAVLFLGSLGINLIKVMPRVIYAPPVGKYQPTRTELEDMAKPVPSLLDFPQIIVTLFLMFLLFLASIIGLGVMALLLNASYDAETREDFPTAVGTLVPEQDEDSRPTTYRQYEYTVEGITYTHNWKLFTGLRLRREDIEPEQTTVTVYYDPQDPTFAATTPPPPWYDLLPFGVSATVLYFLAQSTFVMAALASFVYMRWEFKQRAFEETTAV